MRTSPFRGRRPGLIPAAALVGLTLAAWTLAACVATGPSPSSSADSSPTPVRAASPSVASAPASPGGSPTPFEGDVVVATFLRDFAEAQPPFHVTADVLLSGSTTASATIDMDASGEDFMGTVHVESGTDIRDSEVISVGGVAYARVPGDAWQIIPDYRQSQPINPFGRLEPSQIDYIGPVERSGDILHQLRTTTWIGDDIETMDAGSVDDPAILEPVFDIFVGDDGIPREAQLRFSVTGSSEGQPVRIDVSVDYRFSDVGVPVDIEAPPTPAPTPTPSPTPAPTAVPSPAASG